MVRETSKMAYDQIKKDGLLPQKRFECYEVLFFNGKLTSAEVFKILNKDKPNAAITSSRSRFTELRDMGCIVEVGTKVCTVTGQESICWEATANLPVKLPKKQSSKDRKKEALLAIEKYANSVDNEEIKEELRIIYRLTKQI